VDDELLEELLGKLLMELSSKLLAELSTEVNGDVLFGIHSESEGECSNDICIFCLVYSGSEWECSNNIRMFFFGIHSWLEGECSNDIHMFLFGIHSRSEGGARMIYVCFVWYTFGVRRGVLEWYTFEDMNG